MIPFLDLRAPYEELRGELDAAISRVLESGTYILGQEVEQFEIEYAAYCEAAEAVGVASGLDALQLGLLALGTEPGDEVIVPSNTYIATWIAVSRCGAIPVPVEPDPRTHTISAAGVEAAITARTRAVIPVHLYGMPVDLNPLLATAHRHGIRVLEDAAQAHGTRYRGKNIGAHSDAVAWSFYPGKNLGAMGDAGAVTSDNPDVADRIRVLRNYGSRTKYVNEVIGYNSRLDPLQAAILRVKLRHLDAWQERRRSIAQIYLNDLTGSPLVLPCELPYARHSWHQFVVRHPDRDNLQRQLQAQGIDTLIHYPIPPHRQDAYSWMNYGPGRFPIAEDIASSIFSLPMGPHLGEDQARTVASALVSLLS